MLLPNGEKLSAKVCQENGKALMSNPNSDLGEWLLRKIMKKAEGELVTIYGLDRLGFDSVRIEKLPQINAGASFTYRITLSQTGDSYDTFIGE